MAKIAQISTKYVIHATLKAEGIVDRPDIIGAIFGQTEGLLGKDMELRELQKNGRIGRIEVETFDKNGRTTAKIRIPTSLDKTKTAIIAAAIETIERIGPCNGKIVLDKIEDVRSEKKEYIQERAKEILAQMMKEEEEGEELAREISASVRESELILWGPDKLAAGPKVEDSDELILVEGRADVLALLRAGIENVVAVNGTKIPKSVIDLMKTKKTNIAFVDGDRGGDLIVKALSQVGPLHYYTKAPDGKEVEELTSKEIIKALRLKAPVVKKQRRTKKDPQTTRQGTRKLIKKEHYQILKDSLDEIMGKGVARIYDDNMNLLGEVPVNELSSIRGVDNVYAIVVDSPINDYIVNVAQGVKAEVIVGLKLATRKKTGIKMFTKRTL